MKNYLLLIVGTISYSFSLNAATVIDENEIFPPSSPHRKSIDAGPFSSTRSPLSSRNSSENLMTQIPEAEIFPDSSLIKNFTPPSLETKKSAKVSASRLKLMCSEHNINVSDKNIRRKLRATLEGLTQDEKWNVLYYLAQIEFDAEDKDRSDINWGELAATLRRVPNVGFNWPNCITSFNDSGTICRFKSQDYWDKSYSEYYGCILYEGFKKHVTRFLRDLERYELRCLLQEVMDIKKHAVDIGDTAADAADYKRGLRLAISLQMVPASYRKECARDFSESPTMQIFRTTNHKGRLTDGICEEFQNFCTAFLFRELPGLA